MPRANYFDVLAARDPNSVPKRRPDSKENKGQQNASDQSFANLIASLGMAPTYTPGAAKDPHGQSNVPLTAIIQPRDPNVVVNPRPLNQFTSPKDTNVQQPQSGPRWANGTAPTWTPGSPRDPAVAGNPVVPLTALYPKDTNVQQPPRVPPDRTPDPRYYQKTSDVMDALANNPGLVNALSPTGGTGYATTDMNAAPIANNPKLSGNRAANLAMLYKDAPANPTSGGATPPKKQWIVPKGSQIPAGYEVVGDDGKGGQIVQKQDGAKDDPKAEQAMNQAYLTAGTAVTSAAAPLIVDYLTGTGAAATTGATAGTAAATTGAATTGAATGTAAGAGAAGGAAGAGAGATTAGSAAGAGSGAAGAGTSYVGAVAPYLAFLYAIYAGYQKQQALEGGHRKVKGKLTDEEIDKSAAPPGKHFFDQPARAIFGKEGQNDLEKLSAGHTIMQAIYGSGKHEDQLKRDRIRRALKTAGMTDQEHNILLPDGTKFQIGVEDKIEGTNLHPYDVDFSNEEAGDVVGLVDPMSSIMTDADKKLRRDLTGFYTNAVLASPNDKMANIRGVYEKAGLDYNTARTKITEQAEDGKIDEGTRDAYYASLDRLFGVGAPMTEYTGDGGGSGGSGGSKPKPKPSEAPKAAPTLSSIIPKNEPPPAMPEPDDEKTPQEQQAVNDYIAMLNGRIGNDREQRKQKKEKYSWKTSSKRS